MPWWTSTWAHRIGWTLLYALAIWGLSAIQSLLAQRPDPRRRDVASWAWLLIPLALAFLIGVRLRTWWWVGGPPIAIVITTLAYPTFAYLSSPRPDRQKSGAGLTLAVILTVIDAVVASIATAAGVVTGKILLD